MTDEQAPSEEAVIRAIRQVLEEAGADQQDIDEFVETLKGNDADEFEMNIGAGFGQLCPDYEAAFARYAELIGAEQVKHNPIPKHVPGDADEPQHQEGSHMEDL